MITEVEVIAPKERSILSLTESSCALSDFAGGVNFTSSKMYAEPPCILTDDTAPTLSDGNADEITP